MKYSSPCYLWKTEIFAQNQKMKEGHDILVGFFLWFMKPCIKLLEDRAWNGFGKKQKPQTASGEHHLQFIHFECLLWSSSRQMHDMISTSTNPRH